MFLSWLGKLIDLHLKWQLIDLKKFKPLKFAGIDLIFMVEYFLVALRT